MGKKLGPAHAPVKPPPKIYLFVTPSYITSFLTVTYQMGTASIVAEDYN